MSGDHQPAGRQSLLGGAHASRLLLCHGVAHQGLAVRWVSGELEKGGKWGGVGGQLSGLLLVAQEKVL